jgi:hypothetical protein
MRCTNPGPGATRLHEVYRGSILKGLYMRKNAIRGAIALIACSPMAVLAAGPTYNYIDAAYLSVDVDNGPTLDGFGVAGSFALTESFHIVASYSELSKNPLDLTGSSVALGWNHSLNDITDVVVRAGWEYARVQLFNWASESDNGWSLEAGLRSMLTPQFELNGFISHVDIFGGDEQALSVGGVYYFTPSIGLGAGVTLSDDATGWNVGFRFAF